MNIVLVFSTAPDSDSAQTLAERLVEERLAACVSLLPRVNSVYRWHGKLEHASEVMLLIKTAADVLPQMQSRLVELHPYDVPEVVVLPSSSGLPAYFDWVVAETRADSSQHE